MNTVVVYENRSGIFGLKQQPDDEYVREEDASASSSQVFPDEEPGFSFEDLGFRA